MSQSTPTSGCGQLSCSLKERLKKCGRYHNSPVPTGSTVSSSPRPSGSVTGRHDHSTPNRKRTSSSPPLGKVSNKRKILKCSDSEDKTFNLGESVDDNLAEGTVATHQQLTNQVPKVQQVESKSADNISKIKDDVQCDLDDKHSDKSENEVYKTEENEVNAVGNEETKYDKVDDKDEDVSGGTPEVGGGHDTSDEVVRQKLLKELQDKQETLRQLKMVQMYRTKNDLTDLQVLIDKWRAVAQQGLPDLQAEMQGEPKPSLSQLIDHLGIPHDLVQYDPEEETFGT